MLAKSNITKLYKDLEGLHYDDHRYKEDKITQNKGKH